MTGSNPDINLIFMSLFFRCMWGMLSPWLLILTGFIIYGKSFRTFIDHTWLIVVVNVAQNLQRMLTVQNMYVCDSLTTWSSHMLSKRCRKAESSSAIATGRSVPTCSEKYRSMSVTYKTRSIGSAEFWNSDYFILKYLSNSLPFKYSVEKSVLYLNVLVHTYCKQW